MARLRKGSELKRRTVLTTGRVILFPETDAPPGSYREVVLTLPEDAVVSVAIGPQRLSDPADLRGVDDAGATPEDIAEGRYFQWPQPAPGVVHKFRLLPEQWIAAMSQDGIADTTLYIEYLEE